MTTSFDTHHGDMVHDAQMDYYGKRLATCSSDRTIRVFNSVGDQPTLVSELKGHEGPVWQIAWAHPKFGSVLASCSYDRKVLVWKETNDDWSPAFSYAEHELSVNSIAWAPAEYGLMLACASSDGHISILSCNNNQWSSTKFPAHQVGCNSVSWAPALSPSALLSQTQTAPSPRRIVSGGSDNLVKIWRFAENKNQWELEHQLEEHKAWVRDVAWAENIGLPYHTIASCSQDGVVCIWTQEARSGGSWGCSKLPVFSGVVWRVSWSITGNILAVSSGENDVSLWKHSLEQDGDWAKISQMDDTGALS